MDFNSPLSFRYFLDIDQSGARSIEQMIMERFLGAAAEDDSDDYLPTL